MAERAWLATLRRDIEAHVSPDGLTSRKRLLTALSKVWLKPQVRATLHHRLAHALHERGHRLAALLVARHSLRTTGAEIHPAAVAGPGFCLVHSTGVVIGAGVRIGADARLHHGVTLGVPGGVRDTFTDPVLGERVMIGAYAVVLGALTVGDDAKIGANAVVRDDVPAGATAVGVPARVIRTTSS